MSFPPNLSYSLYTPPPRAHHRASTPAAQYRASSSPAARFRASSPAAQYRGLGPPAALVYTTYPSHASPPAAQSRLSSSPAAPPSYTTYTPAAQRTSSTTSPLKLSYRVDKHIKVLIELILHQARALHHYPWGVFDVLISHRQESIGSTLLPNPFNGMPPGPPHYKTFVFAELIIYTNPNAPDNQKIVVKSAKQEAHLEAVHNLYIKLCQAAGKVQDERDAIEHEGPFRAGYWKCGDNRCGYHDFTRNLRCMRCGASRDGAAVVAVDSGSHSPMNTPPSFGMGRKSNGKTVEQEGEQSNTRPTRQVVDLRKTVEHEGEQSNGKTVEQEGEQSNGKTVEQEGEQSNEKTVEQGG